ncbi:hypothetical protein D7030_10800 [Flavobacteriaceae bacterium AU392]|nr:hypothetical protein D1817_13870 [Flavobacteriaceae bacterium]RKM82652.1 hypothetical protein D7030_10800 [Flavobacteriaceae bacterium AU392]
MKLRILIFYFLATILFNCEYKAASPRFNHVMLYTDDLDATIDFYTTAFDIKVTNHLKKIKRTQKDGNVYESEINIVFLKFPNQGFVYEIAEIPNLSQTENPGYNVLHHVGIDVKNIESASDRILKAGGIILRPQELVEAEGITTKHAFFKGPNGEAIELMEVISGAF